MIPNIVVAMPGQFSKQLKCLKWARLPLFTAITVAVVAYAYAVLVYGVTTNVVYWPLHLKLEMVLIPIAAGLVSAAVLSRTTIEPRRPPPDQ